MPYRMTGVERESDKQARLLAERQKEAANNAIRSGGWVENQDMLNRMGDWNYGMDQGRRIAYDDPDMMNLRQRREDLAKGYSGSELGAMRQNARGEIAGQRSNYLRQMASNLGRGGVGGARGAAMRSAADQGFARAGANAERTMALDSANMVRQGTSDLQDLYMRQKLMQLGVASGSAQLGASDRAAQAARSNNKSGGKK